MHQESSHDSQNRGGVSVANSTLLHLQVLKSGHIEKTIEYCTSGLFHLNIQKRYFKERASKSACNISTCSPLFSWFSIELPSQSQCREQCKIHCLKMRSAMFPLIAGVGNSFILTDTAENKNKYATLRWI